MSDPVTKVCFLDIDGVIIPATQLLVNPMSQFDRIAPATTIACINAFCERSGAKIVFNTTHNSSWENVDDIEIALVKQGLNKDHIHPTDFKTRYPALRRKEAIADWLARHPEIEQWVAIDDAACADEDHMVLINPSCGLHIDDVNDALAKMSSESEWLVFLM